MRPKRNLSKEILMNDYHVINVTENNEVYCMRYHVIEGKRQLVPVKLAVYDLPRKHKHSGTTYYPGVSLWNNKTRKQETFVMSNIVYVWNHDDYDIYKDIDHIDGNPYNNHLDNLQQITRKENNAKRADPKANQWKFIKKEN